MATIQIFDPALCCSTGVCGVDVDEELVRFAADADWARAHGVLLERFNLSQQPMEFANTRAVKDALTRLGQASLPLTLVDGEIKCTGRYPTRAELDGWAGKVRPELSIPVVATPASACCSPSTGAGKSSTKGGGCCS